ncbi:MAG: hypothetical protein J6D47_19605 [Peptostreptococcaceae bacterium]|nr:hypothetical protein [Peptostreptococcaceae bacterium]
MRLKVDIDITGQDSFWIESKSNCYELKIDTSEFTGEVKIDYNSLENAFDDVMREQGKLAYTDLCDANVNLEYENNELLNKISDLEEKIEELENDIEQYQEINEELRRK